MGKGAPLRWIENRWLARHLHGRGIEIGALWRRFPVPRNARVWYIDRSGLDGLERQYPEVNGKIVCPDLLADATGLPFASASLDFLIASHVLEHLPFPLMALRVWYDALAPGGVLLLKVPDKRYTFDSRRSRTPLAHLVAEYEHPELFDWRSHYAEFVENVHGRQPMEPELSQAAADLQAAKFNIHYHAWIDADLREILDYTRQVWNFDWHTVISWNAHFYRKETVALLTRECQ
ncbi:MAG: methyltransferase type 11 [Acidobacteria bacterium]|nr:MAG: methyltransferase type 11 [Acidobacteriota bacterium]